MARRFEFRKQELQLDIAGHKYSVPMNSAISDKLRAFGIKAQEKAELVTEDAAGAEEGWSVCAECIDNILGSGAVDTIFEGRARNLYDILDIIRYITAEVRAYRSGSTRA